MLRSAISISLLLLFVAVSPLASKAQDRPTPATSQKQSNAPKANTDKDAPASKSVPAPTQKKSSADENPFPEEQSKSAAKQVEEGQPPPLPKDIEGESPSGKDADAGKLPSKDEGVSSSRSRLEGLDQGDPDVARKALPKLSDMAHNPKMAAEDVAIGKMYFQSENYRGAYIRYKEALSLDPESPDAAFGVAETARKLNQPKEAIESYQLCLNLDPTGPRSKAARKALAALSSTTAR